MPKGANAVVVFQTKKRYFLYIYTYFVDVTGPLMTVTELKCLTSLSSTQYSQLHNIMQTLNTANREPGG